MLVHHTRSIRYCLGLLLTAIHIDSAACQGPPASVAQQSAPLAADLVAPFHEPFVATSWSKLHPQEKLQTLGEYIASKPNRPDGTRRTMYIQRLGDFSGTQERVVSATADLLSRVYGVPVKSLPPLKLDVIPASARRVHPSWGDQQIRTDYVLNQILKPSRPADAVALLALTSSDLWPGEALNFVFGVASLRDRVGVWSLYRYGDPDQDEAAYDLFLRRTLKVATHETGHMFGIPHCVAYRCCMNGANSIPELDNAPLALCPECSSKVCWATGASPESWYQIAIRVRRHQWAQQRGRNLEEMPGRSRQSSLAQTRSRAQIRAQAPALFILHIF